MDIFRGQIYFYSFGETKDHRSQGTRPVLIVQNDIANKYSKTTIVAPITSRCHKTLRPTQVEIAPMDSGLYCTSRVLCEQLVTVDVDKLKDYVGEVKEEIMRQVNYAIKKSLGV